MVKYFFRLFVFLGIVILSCNIVSAQIDKQTNFLQTLVGEAEFDIDFRGITVPGTGKVIRLALKYGEKFLYVKTVSDTREISDWTTLLEYNPPVETKIVSARFKSDDPSKVVVLLSNKSIEIITIKIDDVTNKFVILYKTKLLSASINIFNPKKIVGDALYLLADNKVYMSRDTATTWSIDSVNIGKLTTSDISVDTNNYGWISTSQGIFYQHPDSNIWRKAAPLPGSFQNATAIFVDRRNRIFVSRPGKVYYSTDRGSSWNDVSDGSIESIVSFGDDAFGNVYAVGQGSRAYRLSNLTLPWISIGDSIKAQAYLPSSEKIINSIIGDSILFAATKYGLFQSTDFGLNWIVSPKSIQSRSHNFYTGVVKGGNYYFISTNLGIYRVAAGDTVWERVFPKQGFIYGINVLASDFVGNIYGNLPLKTGPSSWLFYTVKSTDHGNTWIPDTAGFKTVGINAGTQTFDFFVDKQGTQYLGGSGIFYSKKPGQVWKKDTAGIGMKSGEYIADVSLNNKKGVTYLCRRAGGFPTYSIAIYQRVNGDSIWHEVNTTSLATTEGRMISDHNGDIIVRTLSGSYKIWRYDGSIWSEILLPTDIGSVPFALNLTVDNSGVLWGVFVGSNVNKGVYFTTNNGASWKYVGLTGVGIKYLNAVDDSVTTFNKTSGSSLSLVYAVTFVDGIYGFTTSTIPTTVHTEHSMNVQTYELFQNYPNPFNPTTNISFILPIQSRVTLKIFDILGREITTLLNEEKKEGTYLIPFNGTLLASGVYFYRLQAGSFVQTKKLLLQK
jgi:photosystem II stability/assembly factor-like uncharacterized protein